MLTIILTGGGSGGHITPLLSLAQELKKQEQKCHIVYIGLKGEKLEGLQARYAVFDEVCFVTSGKFRRYYGESYLAHLVDVKTLILNFRDLFRVVIGFFSARKILKRVRPDVVFSKGGFVVVPVGIAAHQLNLPIITHDSDTVPGLANRLIGRWAAIHAVGQPAEYYNYPKDSIRYTGIPLDARLQPVTAAGLKEAKQAIGLSADALVLLIAGGGLGSLPLNNLTTQIASQLLLKFPNLRIIHISGQQHKDTVAKKYSEIPESEGRVEVMGFTPDFYKYSSAADLIFSRAGATTLAEFAQQHKACVIMPAAQLTGGHQLQNTKRLQQEGAIEVLQDESDAAKLLKVLSDLLQDQQRRQELGAKFGALAQPDAASKLATIILETAKGRAGV